VAGGEAEAEADAEADAEAKAEGGDATAEGVGGDSAPGEVVGSGDGEAGGDTSDTLHSTPLRFRIGEGEG
jgi:hypothetical protein